MSTPIKIFIDCYTYTFNIIYFINYNIIDIFFRKFGGYLSLPCSENNAICFGMIKDNLLTLNHKETLLISLFADETRVCKFVPLKVATVSSAKRENQGPRTEPCGTPQLLHCVENLTPLTITYYVLWCK